MRIVIFDLEWNDAYHTGARYFEDGQKFSAEIIEIGAVLLDAHFNICDCFSAEIKPNFYKTLNVHISELTGLNSSYLSAEGITFPEAYEKFRAFCGDDTLMCSWDSIDSEVMRQNAEMYGMTDLFFRRAYDLQNIYYHLFESESGVRQRSLCYVLAKLDIDMTKSVHRALNDALYTAQIMQKLSASGLFDVDALQSFPQDVIKKRSAREIFYRSQNHKTENVLANLTFLCPNCNSKLEMTGEFVAGKRRKLWLSAGTCPEHGLVNIDVKRYSVRGKNRYTLTRRIPMEALYKDSAAIKQKGHTSIKKPD